MSAALVIAEAAGWLEQAAEALEEGCLVAFPTDTVYGIGAHASQGLAIRKLFEAKGRPRDKGIPILVVGAGQAAELVQGFPGGARRLAERFWPGPLTLVLQRRPGLPEELGPGDGVAVRAPDHPVAQMLLTKVGPLAVTSANRSGEEPAVQAKQVLAQLGESVDLIVDGGTAPGGVASTVVDCRRAEPVLLRRGPVEWEIVRRVWNREAF